MDKKKPPTKSPPKPGCAHFFIRDVPDEIHRAAKSHAALLGIPLREFVIQLIQEKVAAPR